MTLLGYDRKSRIKNIGLIAGLVTGIVISVIFTVSCNHPPETSTEETPVAIGQTEVTDLEEIEHENVIFPENLKWLAESEKQKAIDIALNTPEAREKADAGSEVITELGWILVYSGDDENQYDIVETGIPEYPFYKRSETGIPDLYPDVLLRFGEPSNRIIDVAINLVEEKVAYIHSYPARIPPSVEIPSVESDDD